MTALRLTAQDAGKPRTTAANAATKHHKAAAKHHKAAAKHHKAGAAKAAATPAAAPATGRALGAATGTEALRHAVAPQSPYLTPDELLADLRIIQTSLKSHHAHALIAPRLKQNRPAPCPKGCDHALEYALITAPEKRSAAMKKKLEAVAGRMLKG